MATASKQATLQPPSSSRVSQSGAKSAAAPHPNPFTNLQRAVGNQGMLRLLHPGDSSRSASLPPTAPSILQTKLTINQPGDIYEQEADRVADQVMRADPVSAPSHPATEGPGTSLQRSCACGGTCDDCKKKKKEDDQVPEHLHRKAAPAISQHTGQAAPEGATEAPASVHQVLRSPGQPLDTSTRDFMESRLGQDFSAVRIHTGQHAAQSADEIHARAYTVGENIVFANNQFSPASTKGRELLAHELAHVAQQNSGATALQRQPANDDDANATYKAFLEMPQIDKDRAMAIFPGAVQHEPPPKPPEKPAEAGCHSDPYAHPGSQSTCARHHKTEDEATAVTRKHLNDPPATDYAKLERAKLDRLNEAYLTLKRTGAYTHREEFAPYDIETDNLHTLTERWSLCMEAHKIDQNDLAMAEFDDRYFVSKREFRAERRRRIVTVDFEKRFYTAVRHVKNYTNDSMKLVTKNLSPDEIFLVGLNDALFVEEEKPLVYEKQGQIQRDAEEDRRAKDRQIRRDAEIQQEMAWEAQGDAVANQGMNVFIQPLAMIPLGIVGAALGGMQTGEMVGGTYNACVKGQGDCTSELLQLGITAATHYAFKAGTRSGDPVAQVANDVVPAQIPVTPKDVPAANRPVVTAHAEPGVTNLNEVKPPAVVDRVRPDAPQKTGRRIKVDPPPPRTVEKKVTKPDTKPRKKTVSSDDYTAQPKDPSFAQQRAEHMGDAADSPEVSAMHDSPTPQGKTQGVKKAVGNFGHNDLPGYLDHFRESDPAMAAQIEKILDWPEGVAVNKTKFEMSDGRPGIPDGIDVEKGDVIELKPNTKSRWAQRGHYQAAEYAKVLNDMKYRGRTDWKPRVLEYDAQALEKQLKDWGVLPDDPKPPKGKPPQ